jgi:glycosyltransferase involved in cell wall biosynthesis
MRFTIGLPITKTKYLKHSLESIDAQTFKDYEVIIRNNANTPEVKAEIKEICKDWINRKNVTYEESIEQLNMPANFNKIVEKAKGEFFTILSDDDVIAKEFLHEINVLVLKYINTKVFHCRVKLIDGQSKFIGITEICPEWEKQEDFVFQRIIEKRDFFLSDFIVNTAALKEIGGFSNQTSGWGVDEITWSSLAYNGVGFINKLLLNYRIFPGNFSLSSENLKKRFKDIEVMHDNFERIIHETCGREESLYPLDWMLELNNKRTQGQNDLVFKFQTRSGNIIENISFYLKNKSVLTKKRAIKELLKSSF